MELRSRNLHITEKEKKIWKIMEDTSPVSLSISVTMLMMSPMIGHLQTFNIDIYRLLSSICVKYKTV